ncbi:hypothetical protein BGZ46_005912, partial [Entomortierella lignicola]
MAAQNACFDYVIKAILKMAGGSNGARRDANKDAVICIGLGSFKTNRGQVSKHGLLTKKLVEKAKSLNYPIVGCHEYYTSAKCPRPGCDSFLENVPYRSKYCRNCKAYFDRDAVGAENIARVCESQIRYQSRPEKYMPLDKPEDQVAEGSSVVSGKKRRVGDEDDNSGSGSGSGSGGGGGGGGGGGEGSRPRKQQVKKGLRFTKFTVMISRVFATSNFRQ